MESSARYGTHGRVLVVDLTDGSSHVEEVEEKVYRDFLAGYGLGAYLMWKHYPPRVDPLATEACFAVCAGLLTGVGTPFSTRMQIVGKSPLTGTWADSNSGGTLTAQLRAAGYDALMVRGKAEAPSVLVIHDDEVRIEPAGELWGQEVPETFNTLRERYGGRQEVGVSAIGPAGEKGARIACVMNDRYHAWARQGFGALFGAKNLKAIVVAGSGSVPVADPDRYAALCKEVNDTYRRSVGLLMRIIVALSKPNRFMGWLYRLMARRGIKSSVPVAAMRQMWTDRGTTGALAMSVENGDSPIKNWIGVAARDFPLSSRSHRLDGKEVDRLITRRLSCGECPMPCKGIVAVKSRGLVDVRRPDYETLCGFGANLLNDDLESVVACHDACNRYGIDAISASAVLGWVAEAVERGLLSDVDLDGHALEWGDGEAALALTVKMGEMEGCGAWLANGVARAAEKAGNGTEAFAVHVRGQEPAYHDPRFTSMMGVTYIADPTPGRHTAGSGSWHQAFGVAFPLPEAVPAKEQKTDWKSVEGKGTVQAHYSNAYQVLNGLGLCMFTMLTGNLPWREMVNALTGWEVTEADLLRCGERIQNLRAAFNWREGLTPSDFAPHPRMQGTGDGKLDAGPLRGVEVPLDAMRRDYMQAMGWDPGTGRITPERAEALGIAGLLKAHLAG
jgi:aldehyde:ferredoxin oxidoreductase